MNPKKSTKKADDDENGSEPTTENGNIEKQPWEQEWGEFDDERFEFVNWIPQDSNCCFTELTFEHNAPTKFINKWGREQWKILVIQDHCQKWLSGGKRLFESIKRLCKEFNLPPKSIPQLVRITRIGKSVLCQYKAEMVDLK